MVENIYVQSASMSEGKSLGDEREKGGHLHGARSPSDRGDSPWREGLTGLERQDRKTEVF